jgi:hypothetical protein
MVAAASGCFGNGPTGLGRRLFAFQEAEVLGPGHVHKDFHAVFVSQSEQPFGREMVCAQGVDAGRPHAGEVISNSLRRWKLLAMSIGSKGAVGDALNPQSLFAARQELAIDPDPVVDYRNPVPEFVLRAAA